MTKFRKSDVEIIQPKVLKVDTISEYTSATGVTLDGVKLKDSEPYCDVINEKTSAAGVTIDGVKLKDSQPYCDVINEKTGAAGVTIDSVLCKDGSIVCADGGSIEVDTVNEATLANGVVVDGVTLKDGGITATAAKSDFHQFVGLSSVLAYSAGTWTRTRIAQGNYVQRKTAADDTTIIGIDITPEIRAAASKGFKLDSISVISDIGTANLEAHTATLDRIDYVDETAVEINSIPITGTLTTAFADSANPHVDVLTVTTPAYDVDAASKYILEITVNAAATSDYDFHGIVLNYSRNDF